MGSEVVELGLEVEAGAVSGWTAEETNVRALAGVLLSLAMLVGFSSNALLLATLLSSASLRRSAWHLCVGHLAGLNLAVVSLHMLFSLLLVAGGGWAGAGGWAEAACGLSAGLGLWAEWAWGWGLAVVLGERSAALLSPRRYGEWLRSGRLAAVLAAVWALSLASSLPVSAGWLPASLSFSRLVCTVQGAPLAWAVWAGCLHGAALLCWLGSFVVLGHRAAQLRRDHRLLSSSHINDAADKNLIILQFQQLQGLLQPAKLSVILAVSFLLLQGPSIVLGLVDAVGPAESSRASGLTTFVSWLRLVWPLAFPFMVWGDRKEVWRETKWLVCMGGVTVGSLGTSGRSGASLAGTAGGGREEAEAPVLTVGPEGLYLRRSTRAPDGALAEDLRRTDVADLPTSDYGGSERPSPSPPPVPEPTEEETASPSHNTPTEPPPSHLPPLPPPRAAFQAVSGLGDPIPSHVSTPEGGRIQHHVQATVHDPQSSL